MKRDFINLMLSFAEFFKSVRWYAHQKKVRRNLWRHPFYTLPDIWLRGCDRVNQQWTARTIGEAVKLIRKMIDGDKDAKCFVP